MRALLKSSRTLLESSRAAVALLALAAALAAVLAGVFGLARAAEAGGDLGFRRETLWPEPAPALRLVDVPAESAAAAPVRRHRRARRIWAASRSRPLRITLARRPAHRSPAVRGPGRAWAAARPAVRRLARSGAAARPGAEPQVVFPSVIVLPRPPQPVLVSIYQDRTLRNGDAVMMADGIHVFRGRGAWPHQPRDFVRLTFVAALDWHLRRTLDALDRYPPTRWSAAGSAAG